MAHNTASLITIVPLKIQIALSLNMAALVQILFMLGISHFINIIHADIVRKELRSEELIYDNIIQLERPIHYNRFDPSRVVQLSWQPRVFLYQGFLSNEECDHLMSLAKVKQDNSAEIPGELGDIDTAKLTRSSEIILTTNDVRVERIEDRISAWTFLPKENSKLFQILQIRNEDAKQKYDYFGNKSILLPDEHLMATVILYLSNVSHGGQINFPESEAEDSHHRGKIWSDCEKTSRIVRPIKGNALLFFNIHLNASPDKSSSHARCPVVEGEQWVATKIFYLKASTQKAILLEPEKKIMLESEKSDCTDEDESCAQWAAIGECERNPVFMIGSPDYYGTCRKSCNSC